MTFGEGGHSKLLLSTGKDIRIIGMDRDPFAFQKAVEMSQSSSGRLLPILAKFSELPALLDKYKIKKGSINGAIIDLGPSKLQFNDSARGFWFDCDGPLDMRMDGDRFPNSITADDVINSLDSEHLAKIFKTYGEEKYYKKYANAIVDSRFMLKRLSSTFELAKLIATLNNDAIYNDEIRSFTPALKVFQALRIFVNNEVNELNYAILKLREYLCLSSSIPQSTVNLVETIKLSESEAQTSDSGKLIVLPSNILEDRLVKKHFQGVDVDDPLTQLQIQKLKSNLNLLTSQELSRYFFKKWLLFSKPITRSHHDFLNRNPLTKLCKLRLGLRIK